MDGAASGGVVVEVLVHLVADYGAGDLAFAEAAARLVAAVPTAQIHETTGRAAGHARRRVLCRAARFERRPGRPAGRAQRRAAPRPGRPARRQRGRAVLRWRTDGGVLVIGPNSGYSFSFCARELTTLRYLAARAGGSQFRSRDLLPDAIGELVRGGQDQLAEPVRPGRVPSIPQQAIVYTDGYGNIKTTIREPPAEHGARVSVRIGEITVPATVTDGTFAVGEGELALAPGSSGWKLRHGGSVRFYELFLRGGSAAQRFGTPRAGSPIAIQPAGRR